MSYDWEKICKNKSDKELYHIFTGKTVLNEEAKLFAETELKNRKFNFNNLSKHRIKWELEVLKQEEIRKRGFLAARSASANDLFQMLIISFLFPLIAILKLFLAIFNSSSEIVYYKKGILFLLAGLGMNLFIFILYRIKKKNEMKKKSRIQELTKQLKQKNTGNIV